MAMSWFRHSSQMSMNPKVQSLTDREYRHWMFFLELANQQEKRGVLPPNVDRIYSKTYIKSLAALIKKGFIDETSEGLVMHDWNDWQYDSDDKAKAMAEKRARNKTIDKKMLPTCYPHVGNACYPDVTHRTDTDTDTDTDTEDSSTSVRYIKNTTVHNQHNDIVVVSQNNVMAKVDKLMPNSVSGTVQEKVKAMVAYHGEDRVLAGLDYMIGLKKKYNDPIAYLSSMLDKSISKLDYDPTIPDNMPGGKNRPRI